MTAPELCKETAADAIKLIELSLTEDTGAFDLAKGVDCTTDSIVNLSEFHVPIVGH